MNTKTTTPAPNPWGADEPQNINDSKAIAKKKTPVIDTLPEAVKEDLYDLEGLMNDFPTAKELERFVYDETGIVLQLKGRANKLKYQVAMDCLNGKITEAQFIGKDNPYVDKADMVPVDPIKPAPPSDPSIPEAKHLQNSFHSRMIPHLDGDLRAQGRCVEVTFRKYSNGMVTYDVLGPIDERAVGEKIDKYGRTRPEIITWVDPRSGEQVAQRPDGTLTPMGRNLRTLMRGSERFRVNKTNQWDVWVDRDFIQNADHVIRNPWDVGNSES